MMNNPDINNTALPIYFDYMATTPVDPRVIARMIQYLGPDGVYGNAASTRHVYGLQAAQAVEHAREQVAAVIHASPAEIVFTSGATESNNLAILGAARFYRRKGNHLITMTTEHKSVLDTFAQLEKEGFNVTYLKPSADGLLDFNTLMEALTPETILVSIMHVNNEIGVIQDIPAIAAGLRNRGIIFHVDAAQSAGKLAIDLRELPVDLMSLSGHKNYGPKGIGALYVRRKPRIRLQAQTFGGGHEGGLRSGTLPVHQIVGLAEALSLSESMREQEQPRLLAMRRRLWEGIRHLPGIQLNGHPEQRIAGNLNMSFSGIDSDSLLLALRELAVSTTSACASASTEPSYVLRSLGLSEDLAYSSIRLSLGRFTSDEQIDAAIQIICRQIEHLRKISPL
ncbi:IscS subfamily cysteine desulfurase [Legionella sp. CNM-4043-24]|uniref:IscS subfamily cysteine desulfurase n=1 Tax=Legionella sp. CNM-4043-24 TaxID=3421646 RepID=UPI00403AD219